MNRLMIFACILLLLCGATGCCKKGSNRLDIALEGPWILYEDSQFDDHGKKVPALIAIAPIGATVESLKPDDYAHHHSPQLSTGDGFYIQKPFLKKAHIFCLTFDGKCAPEGPESLSSDSYPPSRLLKLTRISGSGAWDWVTASKMQAVLILPMPDSFSNDGTWNMRFGPKGDETHSIGLHLHYANGPEKFSLQFCDETKPTVANCNNSLGDSGQPDPALLTNSGTLRIQMRAPDNDDPCDWHVRNAWEETFKILSPVIDAGYAHLEPAQVTTPDGTGQYGIKPCPQGAPHSHFPEDRHASTPDRAAMTSTQNSTSPSNELLTEGFFKQFSANLETILAVKHEDSSEWQSLVALQHETQTLNPNFPRISQLRLIAGLSRSSVPLIDRLSSEHSKDQDLISVLNSYKIEQKDLEDDAATKNGGDCRAPLVMVQ